MGFIDGVGGAFVFSHDPKRLANWYADNLGLAFEGSESAGAYYLTFWSLDPDDPTRRLDTHFSIIRAHTPMNRPVPQPEPESMYGDQPFMVNLRTRHLDALVSNLASRGVAILKRGTSRTASRVDPRRGRQSRRAVPTFASSPVVA
jgi:hypothetical protein